MKSKILGLLAVTLLVAAQPASANTVTFAGTVTAVDSALTGFFSVGNSISGSYTFNYPVANCGSPHGVCVYDVVTALSATFGSYTYTYGGSGSHFIEVRNNFDGSTQDLYRVKTNVTGSALGGYSPYTFELLLIDTTGTAFSSTDLPGALPDFTKFANRNDLNLVFCSSTAGCGTAKATVTGDQVAAPNPVPLPAAAWLLLSGLGGLGLLRRRKPV